MDEGKLPYSNKIIIAT